MDLLGFYLGEEFEAYRYLGAQLTEGGVCFRTFAPEAVKISVIGEFNGWTETQMQKIYDGNLWEVFISGAEKGMMYKYRIYRKDGSFIDHCDPYGFAAELRPKNASVIGSIDEYKFQDKSWMRKRKVNFDQPLNIYELHAGSWRKKGDGDTDWYDYEELAEKLIPYLKETGYNYLELMPLAEHPSDESWGYQITGFFAPTSRYGTATQLQAFVDKCHRNDIGVIMDFVPVHFAVNDYALWNYDGSALYEYPHHDVGVSEWGSCNFMHSRGEVRSFLQSAANYWLKEYHFDGIRMDAVRNLIYWNGQPERGKNMSAIQFLQRMNTGLKERFPDAMLIAEDSTACPGVTAPVQEGGLGFDYKWDLGWMHDTLEFFQTQPDIRADHMGKLGFSMHYFYNERYILPLSHDEVVHGKATILQKMYGDYENKFPQARLFYLYMTAHPGKKLNFMGNEFGQLREWSEKREQDWMLFDYPKHQKFYQFMKELNIFYRKHPALYKEDYEGEGFQWDTNWTGSRSVMAFTRKGGGQKLLFLFNFEDTGTEINLQELTGKSLKLLMDTDWEKYDGTTTEEERVYHAEKGRYEIELPAYAGKCLEIIE